MAPKLYRSRDDRMIGGVCAGIAAYLALDASLVRLLWLLTVLLGGTGILAYLIAWVIIPEEPALIGARSAPRPTGENQAGAEEAEAETVPYAAEHSAAGEEDRGGTRRFAGVLLIAVGIYFLTLQFLPRIPWFLHLRSLWPLILVAVGIIMLVRGTR